MGISPTWPSAFTRSSCAATRTSSARSRPTPPARVRENWERHQARAGRPRGRLPRRPRDLPALLYARKIQRRAAAANFEYPDAAGALADLEDELRELKHELVEQGEPAPETEPDRRQAEELGDLLFACVNVARRLNVDPELELRSAANRFRKRVEIAEGLAAARGENWSGLPLERQDHYFDLAKETSP